jgi:hypothetical protein
LLVDGHERIARARVVVTAPVLIASTNTSRIIATTTESLNCATSRWTVAGVAYQSAALTSIVRTSVTQTSGSIRSSVCAA